MKMILIYNKFYGEIMSKVLIFTIAALMSFSVFAAKVNVDIKGMTCGMCEGKVTEMLNKTGKCTNVKVDAAAKKATFETKGELSDSEIKKAVQEAGYEATKITRS